MSQAGANGENSSQEAIEFVEDVGSAVPIAGIIEIRGGTGITTMGAGNVVTISATSTGLTWTPVTSADNVVQIVAEHGYICNGVALVVFLLPLTPNVGDGFEILSNTARFQITENGSQIMRIGTANATAGIGTVTSNSSGDGVRFTYIGGNVFQSDIIQGTLTVN